MKAQDKSMENFDEKYRRKILDEMQRKAMHSATHVKNMTNVFDKLPYSTSGSLQVARMRAFEAADMDSAQYEAEYHARMVGRKPAFTPAEQKAADILSRHMYLARHAKHAFAGTVTPGPNAPGNRFEEITDGKAMHDRMMSDAARLQRHYKQNNIAIDAEHNRHIHIEDKMVLQEMQILKNKHNNDLRTAQLGGTIDVDKGKIEATFESDVHTAAEHHTKCAVAFSRLEQKHQELFRKLDNRDQNTNTTTMSYLTKFNSDKAPKCAKIFNHLPMIMGRHCPMRNFLSRRRRTRSHTRAIQLRLQWW